MLRAFTLIEMLVAMSVFVTLGAILVGMVQAMVVSWRNGERLRRAHERAQASFAQMALDFEATYTREPVPSGVVPTARFFCVREAKTGTQRLDLVRTFETGPERAITYYAGSRQGASKTYTDGFTGPPTDLKAIGGLLGVSYFLRGRELRRATQGPPVGPSQSRGRSRGANPAGVYRTTAGEGEVLSAHCLYLRFRFWTQYTESWEGGPPVIFRGKRGGPKGRGPETVWDSTRGAGIGERDERTGYERPFAFTIGPESLADSVDDVFPEVVEVTLVLEPDERRAVRTDLTEGMMETDRVAHVASTRGFEDPKYGSKHLLIGSEWVKVKEKHERRFVLEKRGVRHTPCASHEKGTEVRAGVTFVSRFHVPAFREDEGRRRWMR